MDFIQELINSWYFKKGSLKKWEVLFNEWEENTKLYIILTWQCNVSKTVGQQKTKEISVIKKWDIIGEWSLNWRYKKQNWVFAINKVEYISIDSKSDFQNFSNSFPKLQQKLLINIIDFTNSRLLEINSELTSNYHVSEAISNMSQISQLSIKNIILLFWDILESTKIVYLEKNPVIDTYYKIVYHSTLKTTLKNSIIEIPGGKIEQRHKEVLSLDNNCIYHEITLWWELEWIIIVSRENGVYDNKSMRILANMCTSFAWIINQKKIQDEQRNISYSKRK